MAGSSGRQQIGNCTVWTSTRDNWRDVGTQGAWKTGDGGLGYIFWGGSFLEMYLVVGYLQQWTFRLKKSLQKKWVASNQDTFQNCSQKIPCVRAFALTGAKNPCQIKSLARSTCMHMLILPPTLLYWMPKTQQDKNGHPKSSDNIKILRSCGVWWFQSAADHPLTRGENKVHLFRAAKTPRCGAKPTVCEAQNGAWKHATERRRRSGFLNQKAWHGNMKGSDACSWTARISFLLLFIVYGFKNYGGQKDGKLCLVEVVCCSILSSTYAPGSSSLPHPGTHAT